MKLARLGLAALPLMGCAFLKQAVTYIPQPTAAPVATETSTPAATSVPSASPTDTAPATGNPAPTFTPKPSVAVPPPLCLINGGLGFNNVWPQKHQGLVDSTPWFYMGDEWAAKNAFPNGGWHGGNCSPCDPDHAAAFNGPCNKQEWGTKPVTRFKLSGPGVATWGSNPDNSAQVYVIYNPGLPIYISLCPALDMTDVATGLQIPQKFRVGTPPNGTDEEGCRNLEFTAPAQ